MFYETVSESTLGVTDVEEATSGAADTVEQVDGCTGEPLPDMKVFLWASSRVQEQEIGAGIALTVVAGKGAGYGVVSGDSGTDEGVVESVVPTKG
eukprot:g32111.t1